jgi:long-chain acyl-CoA synthetase
MTQDLKKLMPQARATISGPVAVEAPGFSKTDGETIPRRNAKSPDALRAHPAEGVHTLYDVLRYSAKKFGNAKAVGSRKIIDVHTETKKIKKMVDGKEQMVDKNWQYFELSGYEYRTFNEFERLCLEIGSGLKHLGFGPADRLHIYAATSMQWLSSAHGAYFH